MTVEIVESPTGATLYQQRLTNGLQMIGEHIPGVESVAAMFWVKTGARDEEPRVSGVSHFLEHMAFKRSRTRTYEDYNREFEEIGAENNAFTWLEMTAYHARLLGNELPHALDLLTDLTHPVIDKADFDQERGVILEEIARHRDQPYSLVLDEFFQTFFPGHPLSQTTLGSPESIKALTVDNMSEYWQRRYGADNMILSLAGNLDWERAVGQIEELSRDWHTGSVPTPPARFSSPKPRSILTDERWNQEHIVLGVPSIREGDDQQYAAAVLGNILGDETGSRLFWSINQTGLADQISASLYLFSDTGVLFVLAVTEPDKAAETLSRVRIELEKLQTGDISEDELERAKMKLLTSTVIEGESTRSRMMGIIDSWLARERLETLDEIRRAIDSVTVDDVRHLLDRFPLTKNQVLTALGPVEEAALT